MRASPRDIPPCFKVTPVEVSGRGLCAVGRTLAAIICRMKSAVEPLPRFGARLSLSVGRFFGRVSGVRRGAAACDAAEGCGAGVRRGGFERERRARRLDGRGARVAKAGREVALQAAEKAFGVRGRFGRALRLRVSDGGVAGRGGGEAAAQPVEVGRAGQRGVQEEDEQDERHAPGASTDQSPLLSLKSQPENLPSGECDCGKFNHTRRRPVKHFAPAVAS